MRDGAGPRHAVGNGVEAVAVRGHAGGRPRLARAPPVRDEVVVAVVRAAAAVHGALRVREAEVGREGSGWRRAGDAERRDVGVGGEDGGNEGGGDAEGCGG